MSKKNKIKQLQSSDPKQRYKAYKSNKTWIYATITSMAGIFGGGAALPTVVHAQGTASESKSVEVTDKNLLSTKKSTTIPADTQSLKDTINDSDIFNSVKTSPGDIGTMVSNYQQQGYKVLGMTKNNDGSIDYLLVSNVKNGRVLSDTSDVIMLTSRVGSDVHASITPAVSMEDDGSTTYASSYLRNPAGSVAEFHVSKDALAKLFPDTSVYYLFRYHIEGANITGASGTLAVYGEMDSTSDSESMSDSTSDSTSDSLPDSGSDSTSDSISDSLSDSISDSISDSLSDSISDSMSDSISDSDSVSDSLSDSISDSDSTSDSMSDSISGSDSTSDSMSDSISDSDSLSDSISDSDSTSDVISDSESTSDSISDSLSDSISDSLSDSTSDVISDSESTSDSISDSDSTSDSMSDSISDSDSTSDSLSDSISDSDSTSDSLSDSISDSDSTSDSMSDSISDSDSTSDSLSDSISDSDSTSDSLS
ncbi:KxYKxGKxW signal peptide domain-containing protein, partial [Weissella oryzae]|uniref:KxYKxGKxW signal peptide domain-containing protein n=1 Tax=Weissella oryzae TaxID=1129792 RepID=UPI0016803329